MSSDILNILTKTGLDIQLTVMVLCCRKYEKSKEMTSQLKSNEESLLAERKQMMDNLRLQEQRYDKMKNHAMQQLEM